MMRKNRDLAVSLLLSGLLLLSACSGAGGSGSGAKSDASSASSQVDISSAGSSASSSVPVSGPSSSHTEPKPVGEGDTVSAPVIRLSEDGVTGLTADLDVELPQVMAEQDGLKLTLTDAYCRSESSDLVLEVEFENNTDQYVSLSAGSNILDGRCVNLEVNASADAHSTDDTSIRIPVEELALYGLSDVHEMHGTVACLLGGLYDMNGQPNTPVYMEYALKLNGGAASELVPEGPVQLVDQDGVSATLLGLVVNESESLDKDRFGLAVCVRNDSDRLLYVSLGDTAQADGKVVDGVYSMPIFPHSSSIARVGLYEKESGLMSNLGSVSSLTTSLKLVEQQKLADYANVSVFSESPSFTINFA